MQERKPRGPRKETPPAPPQQEQRVSRPATNPEAREQQLISLAVDLTEKQLRDGTASAAVITHYLKLASRREALERELLEEQSKLIKSKANKIAKDGENEHLAKAAVDAMTKYRSTSASH